MIEDKKHIQQTDAISLIIRARNARRRILSRLFRKIINQIHRKALQGLSNKQLTDAGIDYAAAGRGKAAAARFDPNIDIRS